MSGERPWAERDPVLQPEGKRLSDSSTQQSRLLLSGFHLANLGHFLGLFLLEKEQRSGWERWAVVTGRGWAVSGWCYLHVGSSLGGYLLSIYIFHHTFTGISRKILLGLIFLSQCFCITNSGHVLAELTSVTSSPQGPARSQLRLCRLYFQGSRTIAEIQSLLILWSVAWDWLCCSVALRHWLGWVSGLPWWWWSVLFPLKA